MKSNEPPPLPDAYCRVVQYFDPLQQERFQHLTPIERLVWLEEVQELYWKAQENRSKTIP